MLSSLHAYDLTENCEADHSFMFMGPFPFPYARNVHEPFFHFAECGKKKELEKTRGTENKKSTTNPLSLFSPACSLTFSRLPCSFPSRVCLPSFWCKSRVYSFLKWTLGEPSTKKSCSTPEMDLTGWAYMSTLFSLSVSHSQHWALTSGPALSVLCLLSPPRKDK